MSGRKTIPFFTLPSLEEPQGKDNGLAEFSKCRFVMLSENVRALQLVASVNRPRLTRTHDFNTAEMKLNILLLGTRPLIFVCLHQNYKSVANQLLAFFNFLL